MEARPRHVSRNFAFATTGVSHNFVKKKFPSKVKSKGLMIFNAFENVESSDDEPEF